MIKNLNFLEPLQAIHYFIIFNLQLKQAFEENKHKKPPVL